MAVPTGKVKEVSAMLKAINAQKDAKAAKEEGHCRYSFTCRKVGGPGVFYSLTGRKIPLPVEFHDVYHDMVTLSSSISGALASSEL